MSLDNSLRTIPCFPPYPGPYKVGTAEYEIPISDLSSSSSAPETDSPISTVSFRVFYPADDPKKPPPAVYWIPDPQREFVAAYARFLGANRTFSTIASYIPTFLQWIKIPVLQDAPIKETVNPSGRWPVMVFSHGIGGSKNTYSYLLGSFASHGMVVVTPEHRDGSGPISIIRKPGNRRHVVKYEDIEHKMGLEVLEKRHRQMRTRLWELGLIHDALFKFDSGGKFANLVGESEVNHNCGPSFKSRLDIHRPGCISWAGHSFGAATMVQFLKSIFWQLPGNTVDHNTEPHFSNYEPLYKPRINTPLVSQVTSKSPLILLDLWTLPLRGENVRWLWEKPLPCHAAEKGSPSNAVAVMSEAFFRWGSNFKATRFVLLDRSTKGNTESHGNKNRAAPRLFYPIKSAHLSQSDIGILFPWIMRKWLHAEDPDKIMMLNVRAALQMLRENGVALAATQGINADESTGFSMGGRYPRPSKRLALETHAEGLDKQDRRIFDIESPIRGWIPVNIEDDGDRSDDQERELLPKL